MSGERGDVLKRLDALELFQANTTTDIDELDDARQQMADVLRRLENVEGLLADEVNPCLPDSFAGKIEAILGRVAALEAKLANAYQEPEACHKHQCSYYQHYLAYGPAVLTHEGYHQAEERCLKAQQEQFDHYDSCPRCLACETCEANASLTRIAEAWEKRVRA